MANNLLTIGQITKEALAIFRNSNAFVANVDRQYDDQFARTGGKIGSTLRIRLPNDYTLRTGPTAVPQSTNESSSRWWWRRSSAWTSRSAAPSAR